MVPDEIVEAVLFPALGEGFVLDGYPRTHRQAHRLDVVLGAEGRAVETAVELVVEEEILCARLALRADAERRADDTPEVFLRRLEEYRRDAPPIREHYSIKLPTHSIRQGVKISSASSSKPTTSPLARSTRQAETRS